MALKYFVLILVAQWWMFSHPQKKLFRLSGVAQGTTYSISYVNDDSIVSKSAVDSIFHVIDLSLSLYEEQSLISRFNRVGKIEMDEHLETVVRSSMSIWKLSHGCFDITVKKLVDLWGFGVGGSGRLPSTKSVNEALLHTGTNYLTIDKDELQSVKSVAIDCNGIAQGYTVDVIFRFLASRDLQDIMVEVGGEVRAVGRKADGSMWRIGLESPSGITEDWYPIEEIVQLDNGAITTSGNYRKYFMNKGKKYSHVIDPRRGVPVDNGIISVTVVAPDAITADGWDNGFYVMGIDSSFEMLKKYPEMDIRIVYQDKEGRIRDTSSAGFKKMMVR